MNVDVKFQYFANSLIAWQTRTLLNFGDLKIQNKGVNNLLPVDHGRCLTIQIPWEYMFRPAIIAAKKRASKTYVNRLYSIPNEISTKGEVLLFWNIY